MKYLDYIVDEQGIHPDPEKVDAKIKVPSPKNVKEIRTFIGTASWYRIFISNFSPILSSVTHLTKKNIKWKWSQECEDSF